MAAPQDRSPDGSQRSASAGLIRSLGLLDATTIVVGTVIGSGVFIVSADIARQVKTPGLLLVVWLLSGLMTLIGALCYAELASSFPKAGGQYVYLREAYGPLCGFLYGWSMLLVIQTATIAAVAIAFSKFSRVFFPWLSSTHWLWRLGKFGPWGSGSLVLGPYEVGLNTQNLLALLLVVLLTWLNSRGLRVGALVQNIFAFCKIAALGVIIVAGLVFSTTIARSANFHQFWSASGFLNEHAYQVGGQTVWVGTLTLIAVAMVGSLFSFDAWNSVTFTAGEVENPGRNLPVSLILGTSIILLVYLLTNIAYLCVLPLSGSPGALNVTHRGIQFAAEDRVATSMMEAIFGSKAAVAVAVAVMVSTFGSNNGLVLSGARVYYALAQDGLFFGKVGTVNKCHVPGAALAVQCVWACLLCLSGTYSQLLDFVIFAVLLFYILTIIGLFVLRRRASQLSRPYRALGYPILPALYVVWACFIEIQLLRYKPQYTWPGLIIVLLGIPVYFAWRLRSAQTAVPGVTR